MSFKLMGLMMAHGPSDQKVWAAMMALADFADDDGRCWPSAERLAERSRQSRASAFRALKAAEADQWIQRAKRFNATGRTSNYYRINVMRLLNAARAEAVGLGVHPDFDPFPEEVAAGMGSSQAETNPVSGGDEPRLTVRREPINEPINEPARVTLANFSVGALSLRARGAWREAVNPALDEDTRRGAVLVLRSEGIGQDIVADDGRIVVGGRVKPPSDQSRRPRSGARV